MNHPNYFEAINDFYDPQKCMDVIGDPVGNYWLRNAGVIPSQPGDENILVNTQAVDVDNYNEEEVDLDEENNKAGFAEEQKKVVEKRKKELIYLLDTADAVLDQEIIPERYFSLCSISKALYDINYNVFDLGDEELADSYYDIIDEVDDRLMEAEEVLDPDIYFDAETAFKKAEKIKKELKRLLGYIKNPSEYKQNKNWSAEIDKLNKSIQMLNKLLDSRLSEYKKDSYFQFLNTVEDELIFPHYYNTFIFNAAVLMAKVDGKIEPSEKDYIKEVGRKIFLEENEIEKILYNDEDSLEVKSYILRLNENKKTEILKKLISVSLADGDLSKEEEHWLFKVGNALGLSDNIIKKLL